MWAPMWAPMWEPMWEPVWEPMWEPTPWAMVFRACPTPIAHRVGSYKKRQRHQKELT